MRKPNLTGSLRASDVPSEGATWCAIEEFALTFKGYDWSGSFEKCADLANSTRRTYDRSPASSAQIDFGRTSGLLVL